jgi:hypothetical protein
MNEYLTKIATKLESLTLPESEHYSEPGRMRFLMAVSQVEHYEQFLRMILRRYEESSAEFQTLAKEGFWDIGRVRILSRYIQLESESFYNFAKTLLDSTATFVQEYFRPRSSDKHLSRGYTLDNRHHYLVDNFEEVSSKLGLSVPEQFLPLAKELKGAISDFRDKHIVHAGNLRMARGIKFRVDGLENPTLHKFDPNPRDGNVAATEVESIALHRLMELLERYFDALFILIANNRGNSAFMREGGIT